MSVSRPPWVNSHNQHDCSNTAVIDCRHDCDYEKYLPLFEKSDWSDCDSHGTSYISWLGTGWGRARARDEANSCTEPSSQRPFTFNNL